MVAYVYRMPYGIPGDMSRPSISTVEAQPFDSSGSYNFSVYGVPVKITSNVVRPIAAAADTIYGFLARPYPTTGPNASDPLGTSVPPTSGVANIMRRGYMTVHVNAGTASLNSQVYVRVANAGSGKPVGGVEAAAEYATTTGAAGTNTGNATIGTLSAASGAQNGAYVATCTDATHFIVADPAGLSMKPGVFGTAYTDRGVTFTITAGATPCVAGDTFTITVTANTLPVTGATFMEAADSAGNAEIAYNI